MPAIQKDTCRGCEIQASFFSGKQTQSKNTKEAGNMTFKKITGLITGYVKVAGIYLNSYNAVISNVGTRFEIEQGDVVKTTGKEIIISFVLYG